MARTLAFVALALGICVTPALADKPGHAGKGKHKHRGTDEVVIIADRDREAVRGYWVETYGRGNCPPGLAKKNNGCLPPGQAKKRYTVGRRLPTTVVVQPVPQVILTRLQPVPVGYQYVIVDGDLLKLAVATRLVVDAIDALVN